MFLDSFRITGIAMAQIFLLGALGYFLLKKNLLKAEGLDALSRLVVEVTLPLLIFCQLVSDFSFATYRNWWLFPLLSIAITAAGFLLGWVLRIFVKGSEHKMQFVSLVTFQNSGYLPLALITALFSGQQKESLLIYLFLFLLGFNLVVWSFGVYMLSFQKSRRFEFASVFSPPAIAVLAGLLVVFLGLNKYIPYSLLKPLRMVGDCTVPLAMLVVGGSLAVISIKSFDRKAVILMILAKLVIMPAIGFWLVIKLALPELIGLLILMQLAVPPATSLSVIVRHYKKEDLLISQGVFFGHLVGLVSLPLFLSLYFMLVMLK